jgi:hypothetical protein
MRMLMLMRFRAGMRSFVRGLRQPKRLALTLAGVGLISFWIWIKQRSGNDVSFVGGPHQDLYMGAFLMFFPLASIWAAARQGLIVFTPEEIHFLFPAPISTRVLLATHLATNCLKSVSAAFIFALFVRPDGVSFAWATLAYGIYLSFVTCLQAAVDIGCIGLDPGERRRRARLLLGGILTVIGSGVALAAFLTDDTGMELLGWAVLPAKPFIALIRARGLMGPGPLDMALNAGAVLALIGVLALSVLRFRGDVRESSHATSKTIQDKLRTIRQGKLFQDAPKERTGGSVLPMFPRLGGAGVHAWRQLSVLRRSRKSYALLIFMTLGLGVAFGITKQDDPAFVAMVMLSVLVFAGPMYVQCDFRSDYECLAWMRSFPSKPGVLAAGQLLSSAIVLYLMQLVLVGWVIFACPPEQRWAWVGAFVMLPVFNLLQLSVWNGAHLLVPVRAVTQAGIPGFTQMVRVYLTMLGVFLTLFIAMAIAGGFGALTWWLLDRVAGLGPVQGVWMSAGLVFFCTLCAVTAICIWCVGRIFVRIDPNVDLAD